MMVRKSDWEQQLSDYLIAKRELPFEYGKNDCACFVSGAIEAITGDDPMSEVSKDYDSEIGSLRVLKGLGCDSVEQFMDAKFSETPIGFAQTGDVALHDGCLGIVTGSKAVFVTEVGYTFVDRSEWSKAWEVGRG